MTIADYTNYTIDDRTTPAARFVTYGCGCVAACAPGTMTTFGYAYCQEHAVRGALLRPLRQSQARARSPHHFQAAAQAIAQARKGE
jgi:hypothetical protein